MSVQDDLFAVAFPPLPWMDEAAYVGVDPEIFHAVNLADYHVKDGQRSKVQQAKAVCRRCPVIGECLEFALDVGDREGIFGGTTPDERSGRRR